MRIIAGKAKGHPIKAPKGRHTRPTADRIKEAVFSVLAPHIPGSRILDAFAGSGALGLEALSRGASQAVFIEADSSASRILSENLRHLGFQDQGRVLKGDALKIIPRLKQRYQEEGFQLVFLDPPYNKGFLDKALKALVSGAILAPDAILVLETSSKVREPFETEGFAIIKESQYGDTAIIYLARERSAGCG